MKTPYQTTRTLLVIASIIASAFLATGCQTRSTELNKVHLGMTEKEVVRILGEPASRAESKDGSTTLYYTLSENGTGSIFAPYSVKLIGGKVDSYGRDGGQTGQVRPAPTPIFVPMAH